MMGATRKGALVTLALVLSACCCRPTTAFVAPSGLGRSTRPGLARHQAFGIGVANHAQTFDRTAPSASSRARRAHEPVMIADVRTSAQRIATLATSTAVVVLAGSAAAPLPALAESQNFAQALTGGVLGVINGPAILAVPIVLGFILASSVAAFIYYFSQPREYDE